MWYWQPRYAFNGQGEIVMADQSDAGANAPPMFGFIRGPQDFFGGLLLIAVALFALYAGDDLSGMHGFSFGPGTAPRLFAGLLIAFGIGITAMGVVFPGPKLERWALRGTILTIASILIFAATIRSLGLILSSFISFMVGAYATDEVRWLEAALVGAGLTIGCAILFPYVLALPFQLWPQF
jgi:putative tricarboxylic transport membrane protein